MAVILAAGLDGVKNEIEPPAPVDRNIYVMNAEERAASGIDSLPGSLDAALATLARDQVIIDALGEHIYANFKEAKEVEFDMFRTTVTQWERDQYLKMY